MEKTSQLSQLSKRIAEFEKKHHLNDTDFALLSRLSVEKVHALKAMYALPDEEEMQMLEEAFASKD